MSMVEPTSLRRGWVVSDGAAGNENQALALARALGLQIDVLRLWARAPWRWLAPRMLPGAGHAFGPAFRQRLQGPLPDVVIGCGRQAALATRLVRVAGQGQVRAVQILDPRIDGAHYDAVVVPRHDGRRGNNVIATLGGLNAVDDEWLAGGRAAFPEVGQWPGPRLAVLLGGPTRSLAFDRGYWRVLCGHVRQHLLGTGGSLLLTTSRRSPAWVPGAVAQDLSDLPGLRWFGPGDGPNPYAGLLGWADAVLVTPDSVNMLSEAAATRVPVWTLAPQPLRGKVGRFVSALHESGRVRFAGEASGAGSVMPLRETARVAQRLRERFGWD